MTQGVVYQQVEPGAPIGNMSLDISAKRLFYASTTYIILDTLSIACDDD